MQNIQPSEGQTKGGGGKMLLVIIILVGILGTVYALTDNRSDSENTGKENGAMTKEAVNTAGQGDVEQDGKGPGTEVLERAGML